MSKLRTHYDKDRDVLYVSRSVQATTNLPWTPNEDILFDSDTCNVVGYIITNFSLLYPDLLKRYNPKERWFVVAFFEERLKDWNKLLSPLRTLKARMDFLSREQASRADHLVHYY